MRASFTTGWGVNEMVVVEDEDNSVRDGGRLSLIRAVRIDPRSAVAEGIGALPTALLPPNSRLLSLRPGSGQR